MPNRQTKETRHAHTRSQETLGCCPVLESSCLPVLVEQCFSPLLFLSSFAFWEESLHFLTTPLQTKSCIFFQWRSALPQLQSQFILQQGTSLYLSLPCRFRCCRTGDGCEASTASSASAKDLAFWKKWKLVTTLLLHVTPESHCESQCTLMAQPCETRTASTYDHIIIYIIYYEVVREIPRVLG